MRMIVPQVELLDGDHGTLLPQLFHGIVMDGVAKRVEQDPGKFAVMKARVQGFKAIHLVAHGLGHALCSPAWAHFDIVGQQAEHALGAEAAGKGPDRIGMGVGFHRALGRRASANSTRGRINS